MNDWRLLEPVSLLAEAFKVTYKHLPFEFCVWVILNLTLLFWSGLFLLIFLWFLFLVSSLLEHLLRLVSRRGILLRRRAFTESRSFFLFMLYGNYTRIRHNPCLSCRFFIFSIAGLSRSDHWLRGILYQLALAALKHLSRQVFEVLVWHRLIESRVLLVLSLRGRRRSLQRHVGLVFHDEELLSQLIDSF